MAVAVTLRRAIPARLRRERACSANKLVFEPSQPSYTQPWRTICTPNIALIALDPCNSVTIVV